MLKASSNGTQATTAIKFSLRPTAETLADLSRPIDPRHLKTRKQVTATLTYCPWHTIALHLHHRAPGGWVLKQRSLTNWEYDPEVRDAIKGLQGQEQRDGRAQPLTSTYLCLTHKSN